FSRAPGSHVVRNCLPAGGSDAARMDRARGKSHLPGNRRALEQSAVMLRRSVLVAIAATLAATGCTKGEPHRAASSGAPLARIDTTVGHAPPGGRIKVEVLNAS